MIMSAYRAAGIVNGSIEINDTREYLEACLYISIHPGKMKGLVDGNQWALAVKVADYAVDNGEEATIKLLDETRADGAPKPANEA